MAGEHGLGGVLELLAAFELGAAGGEVGGRLGVAFGPGAVHGLQAAGLCVAAGGEPGELGGGLVGAAGGVLLGAGARGGRRCGGLLGALAGGDCPPCLGGVGGDAIAQSPFLGS